MDDDGVRARMCEALLERIAAWSDAGWWIYPHSASVGAGDGVAALPSLSREAERLSLTRSRLTSRTAQLSREDLDAYDLVLAVDGASLEGARALLRPDEADAYSTVLLPACDFLCGYRAADRFEALDDELRDLVAPRFDAASALIELPADAHPTARPDEWQLFLAGSVLVCASLVSLVKETIDEGFTDAFRALLRTHYCREEHCGVPWEQAEAELRRHVITGALDPRVRRSLFDEHMAGLCSHCGRGGAASE